MPLEELQTRQTPVATTVQVPEDMTWAGEGWLNSQAGYSYPLKFNTILICLRSTPHPVSVTTRIITFLVGNPYKPSFATGILGGG